MDCDVRVHARCVFPVRWRHLRLVVVVIVVLLAARGGHVDWTAVEVLTR
jgi:hypothetical protein